MQKVASIINNPRGSIITMAMIFLALLTVIGIAATNTSTTERKLTSNALLHNMAFYTADAGIEAGRAALSNLKLADRGSWDMLLANLATPPPDPLKVVTWRGAACTTLNGIIDAEKVYWEDQGQSHQGRTVGPTTFSLTIKDNYDRDNDDTVDTDDTVFLTSTASYRGSIITIEAIVQAGGGGPTYAQEHYDAGSTGEASAESTVVGSDVRWQAL